jgi:hypothetical protein
VIAPSTEVKLNGTSVHPLPSRHGLDEVTDHGSPGGAGQGLSYRTFVIW